MAVASDGSASRCDPYFLPPGCDMPEVVNLLLASCRLCTQRQTGPGSASLAYWDYAGPEENISHLEEYSPCHEDDGTLADLALAILVAGMDIIRSCKLGYLAAYLVTLQYSASTRPLDGGEMMSSLAFESEHSWDST